MIRVAGRLVDVERGVVLANRRLVIRAGRIEAILGPTSNGPKGAAVVDLSDFTVLPGFIDLHTHLVGNIQSASPTAPLGAIGRRDGWPEETLRKNDETTDAQRQGFRKAVAAGVRIGYGTDSGVYPHGDNGKQFRYLVRYGMTPMQAIQSATIEAARMMGWDDRVGSVAVGKVADLVAVRGSPLDDVGLLEHVRWVMKGGVVVRSDR